MVTSRMAAAKVMVSRRTTSSPHSMRLFAGTATDLLAILLDHADLPGHFGNHLRRQRSIAHTCRIFLAIGQHPAQECLQVSGLGGVGYPAGDEQPGEGGDGIGILAPRIGDVDAEIGWPVP